MSLNPFADIDINSCLHSELSPYKIKNGYFKYPNRYYELYLKNLFDQYQIDSKRTLRVEINDHGYLINDLKQITPINLEMIEYEQRKTFYIDKWYSTLKGLAVTFDCFIIQLNDEERYLLTSRQWDDKNLIDLKIKIRDIFINNRHIKWWFIKLNSVSPKDDSKSGKQHKYNSITRIIHRLVDSDRTFIFLKHDDNCQIVLRPWYDLPEKYEFRCFIYKKKLRAISQYSCYTYYPEFQDKNTQSDIQNRIIKFYNSISKYLPFQDCVMDIIIWDQSNLPSYMNQQIYIIEFNEFGGETPCGAGLYNWIIDYDLLYNSRWPVIRFVEHESEIDQLARQLDNLV